MYMYIYIHIYYMYIIYIYIMYYMIYIHTYAHAYALLSTRKQTRSNIHKPCAHCHCMCDSYTLCVAICRDYLYTIVSVAQRELPGYGSLAICQATFRLAWQLSATFCNLTSVMPVIYHTILFSHFCFSRRTPLKQACS